MSYVSLLEEKIPLAASRRLPISPSSRQYPLRAEKRKKRHPAGIAQGFVLSSIL
jgi:hypothetical protein